MIGHADWRPVGGLILEPNAITAIRETSHNCALTAGPGAGKTEMLAQRADFLLKTATCPYPRRILAISFKVDAARNLKDRVEQRCGYQLAARFDSHTFHAFAKRLIDRYRPVLTGINALELNYTVGDTRIQGTQITYKDMVPLALDILEKSPAARGTLRQTYSHLFLDEFQDCTEQQYTLIRTAFLDTPTQVTAVGDTKQRIMAWAGALEGIFQQYAADFSAVPSNLYQNHRSKPRLRRMQNRMIAVMDPAGTAPPEDLQGEEGEVEILRFANDQDEAEHIAGLIAGWLEEGVPPREIAIVVSKQPHLYATPLMEALAKHAIAYRDEQAQQDLAAEPVSALILDFLQVIFDDRQPEVYQRLMKTAAGYTVDEEAGSRARSAIDRYIRDCRRKVREHGFDSTDSNEIDGIAFGFTRILGREAVAGLSPDYERSTRLDDLITKTMAAVHTQIAVDHDPAAALRRLSDTEAVRISTIHKSKGLEFANVIVLAVEKQTYWSNPDAERSAFFVGISRAKDRLVLTTAAERPWPKDPSIRNWNVARTPHHEFLSYTKE
ncbi:UvrD-helicase domain-containing protein [Rhodococcus erythropolis]|uniref:UvrD-helicase domain-containing protein n=1 Tax=Rhodococcus erythropolis TaxID=1833 RepID=UPI00087815BB|nr:ATP-dependent helicase [Rhodococcus erythropolis]OFV75147.1 DNA helicase II [Rhodococcus erythropolis]